MRLEPPRALDRPHVHRDAHDVRRLVGRQHPLPCGRLGPGVRDLGQEHPPLRGRVPVPGRQPDELTVPPQRLGAGGGERGVGRGDEPAQVLAWEAEPERPLGGDVPSPLPVPEGGDGQQQTGEQQGEPGVQGVASHTDDGDDRTSACFDGNSMNV